MLYALRFRVLRPAYALSMNEQLCDHWRHLTHVRASSDVRSRVCLDYRFSSLGSVESRELPVLSRFEGAHPDPVWLLKWNPDRVVVVLTNRDSSSEPGWNLGATFPCVVVRSDSIAPPVKRLSCGSEGERYQKM